MTSPAVRPTTTDRPRFRTEIQGLRAVAALLVAVYHVWFGRVSGGVDVFIVVSGFLMATTLLGHYERYGTVRVVPYVGRLARRLLPAALTVLGAVAVLSVLLLPESLWPQTYRELLASILYYENWQLASDATDYLAQDNFHSPVQHFWAMSVQGQLYLVLAGVFLLGVAIASAVRKPDRRTVVTVLLGVGCAASLGYSIWITSVNQPFAYYSTFARAWEFGLGALAALLLPHLRLPRWARLFLGWLGLLAILMCGVLLNVSTVFPGYAALWPVLAALCILAAGTSDAGSGAPGGAARLLSARPLVWLGGISYGIYLWHWPLLVFYQVVRDRGNVGLPVGLAIIALSILLAWLTNRLIEAPAARRLAPGVRRRGLRIAAGIAAIAVLAGSSVAVRVVTEERAEAAVRAAEELVDAAAGECLGAAVMAADGPECSGRGPLDTVLPAPQNAQADREDKPCLVGQEDRELRVCESGVPAAESTRTVAVVGGSHAIHWLGSLRAIAEEQRWRVLSMGKGSCPWTSADRTSSEAMVSSCREWNAKLTEYLREHEEISYIFTSSSAKNRVVPEDGMGWFDTAKAGYLDAWSKVPDRVERIFAIRDIPRQAPGVVECVGKLPPAEQLQAVGCDSAPEEALLPDPLAQAASESPDPRVRVIDLTEFYCDQTRCSPVVGSVMIYRDSHHQTATWQRTIAPYLFEAISAAR